MPSLVRKLLTRIRLRSCSGEPCWPCARAIPPDRNYSMKYELKSTGSSKLASALCQLCAQGKKGETLVLNGVTQSAVSLFGAEIAHAMATRGDTPVQIAEVFDLASIANASALKQALAEIEIVLESDDDHKANGGRWLDAKGDEPAKRVQLLLAKFWEARGKGRAVPNLSALKGL